ncbi:MAG TPA: hypothetical protein DCL15_15300, partial [Chloroflexi bacterium]|nr:hypothetical protein [Chloroflexota bacterium]HHW85304.1 hypothetical protein [Chloroflexota bacterium]
MPTPEDFTDSPPMPASPAPASVVRPLPLTDHEVQLWDVDVTPMHAGSDASDEAAPRIPDQLDDVLVATLMERRWQVIPGNTVTLPVTVLNNSTHRLTVRAHLEGWLDDRWLVDPYVQTTIPPGERRILELTVAPPRQPQAEAGDYQVAVVVRALETMAHLVRIGLVLTLLPFDRVQLELADAAAPSAAWWRRRLLLPLQIVNAGNHPLVLHLEGATSPRLGAIAFGGSEVAARSTVELRPGQRVRVPVQLTVKRLPLLALHSRVLPFVVTAQDATGKALEQVRGAIAVRPIIGAWQMASFAGVAGAGVAAVSLLLLAGVLFLRAGTTASPVASSPPPVPAVIIVTLNQPVAAPSAPIVVTPSLATALQSQPDPALPLVLPDQVTAPGSGGPARVLAPVEAAPITAAP